MFGFAIVLLAIIIPVLVIAIGQLLMVAVLIARNLFMYCYCKAKGVKFNVVNIKELL